uniref:Uncharacterized protein n=1 Tax=Panagrolaimus superbus TaxID=310955 RepID=A0A914Z9V8_9BILA
MLPIEFYQKLDSKYRKLIYSLDKELENSKTHIHYHEILKSFAELYMIPWQYWKSAHISNYYGDKHYLTLFSLYQFYYSFKKLQFMFYRRSQNSNRRCFKHSSQYLDTNVNLLIHDLQVPHCDLKEIWKLYEQNICSFPPKNIVNIYHKMRDLYDKIISVEKDEEKWMKALMESKNNEFVLQNVECRLGGDLNNKKLWKLYFEFLKQNDIEVIYTFYF